MPASFTDMPSYEKTKSTVRLLAPSSLTLCSHSCFTALQTSYFEYSPDPSGSGSPMRTEFEEYLLHTAISARHMPATGCADTLSTLSLGSVRYFSGEDEGSDDATAFGNQPVHTSLPVRAGSYDTTKTGGTSSSRSSRTVAWARELKRKASRFFTPKRVSLSFVVVYLVLGDRLIHVIVPSARCQGFPQKAS